MIELISNGLDLVSCNNSHFEEAPSVYQVPSEIKLPFILRLFHPHRKLLNGEVKTIAYDAHSIPEKLSENLKLGKKISDYAQSVILFSPNNPQRSPVIREKSLQEQAEAIENIENILQIIRSDKGEKNQLKTIELAEKFNIGTCEEMSAVGYIYAVRNSLTDQIERVRIKPGNHVFLVIGRDQSVPIEDYKNWGPNAVICDPWVNAYYPASKLIKYMRDDVGLYEDENKPRSECVKPFNPKTQSIVFRHI